MAPAAVTVRTIEHTERKTYAARRTNRVRLLNPYIHICMYTSKLQSIRELLQSIRAKGNVDAGFATQRRDNLVLLSPELLQSNRLSTAAAVDQTASIDTELRHGADV